MTPTIEFPESISSVLTHMNKELTCAICLNLFTECTYSPCGHVFCRACILQSMEVTARCPLCKKPITTRRALCAATTVDSIVSEFRELREGYEARSGQVLSQMPLPVFQPSLSILPQDDMEQVNNDENEAPGSPELTNGDTDAPPVSLLPQDVVDQMAQDENEASDSPAPSNGDQEATTPISSALSTPRSTNSPFGPPPIGPDASTTPLGPPPVNGARVMAVSTTPLMPPPPPRPLSERLDAHRALDTTRSASDGRDDDEYSETSTLDGTTLGSNPIYATYPSPIPARHTLPQSIPTAAQSISTTPLTLSLHDEPPAHFLIHPADDLQPSTLECLSALKQRGLCDVTEASSMAVTHFIFPPNGKQIKTCYFFALVLGKRMVAEEWVVQCHQANAMVDAEPYFLHQVGGFIGGPERSRMSYLRGEPKLFYRKRFYLHSTIPAKHALQFEKMLIAGGGRVIKHAKDVTDKTLVLCSGTILPRSSSNSSSAASEALTTHNVHFNWLLRSILAYKLMDTRDFTVVIESTP